jgi:RNA polymerase sigma-70 factor (ECF subfamily)
MDGSITIRLAELAVTKQQESRFEPRVSDNLVPELSDEALMAEVCLGSREALGQLFRRYARTVRRVAYRVLRDVSEADDLLQDVFLLINRLCKTFDGSKAPAKLLLSGLTPARRKFLLCIGTAIMTGRFLR